MKKIFSIIAMSAIVMCANAQMLKNNFFNGYNTGDKLEKAVYDAKDADANLDSWSGAFSSNPNEHPCFTVGEELSYQGYNEKGLSAKFGGFEQGQKGARYSVYTIAEGKQYGKGVYYLSFLINMSKVSGSKMSDLVGLSAATVGGSNRSNICVAKDGQSMRFGISLLKLNAEGQEAFDLNKTHLCVLKYDFKNQKVSLFVDPDLDADEPEEATVSIDADEDNVMKHAIRSVSLRNRSGFLGNIGNFRWSNSWAGVIED